MEEIREVLQFLSLKYYELYPDMQNLSVNTIISDCLSKSYLELNLELKESLKADDLESIDDLNGMMVLPYAVGEPINVLLSRSKIAEYTIDGSMTWMGTFAHELTHAIDFYQMAVKQNLNCYGPLLDKEKYYLFHLWSEYHARKLGYAFLRSLLGVDSKYDETSRIEHIQKTEWPMQFNRHFKEYHETNIGNIQMNSTMQLLGRYSVWCDLFPNEFNEATFKKLFANTPWMYNIFVFLRQHSSLNIVYSKFEDMRLILSEIWKGL